MRSNRGMRAARGRDDYAMAAEWRRLRRAAAFFLGCLAVVIVAGVVGLYH
jgi:hypothetical protein